MSTMEELVTVLRAAGEPTRLRILALLARGELTVTELTAILGHSQPRISRHLKLLVDAGLLERKPEGAWVFYRIARSPETRGRLPARRFAEFLASLVSREIVDLQRDLERLEQIKAARARLAEAYFRENAEEWGILRSLHVPEAEVEAAILGLVGPRRRRHLVDIGTGTGRMLELLAPLVERGEGIDSSREMLSIARLNLDRPELRHAQVRHGDLFSLPYPNGHAAQMTPDADVDLVVLHQVLHYLADPQAALMEAARILVRGGCLIVVDFAPHKIETLREEHAHRRLGFADAEMRDWLDQAGLTVTEVRHLKAPPADGREGLTVSVWCAEVPHSATTSKQKEMVK